MSRKRERDRGREIESQREGKDEFWARRNENQGREVGTKREMREARKGSKHSRRHKT